MGARWLPHPAVAGPDALRGAVRRGCGALVARPTARPDRGLGVLAALAVAGPLVAGLAVDALAWGTVAALAGFNTALVEVPGRAARRLGVGLLTTALNTALTALGALVAHWAWLAALATALVVPVLVLAGLRSPTGRQIALPATLLWVAAAGLPPGPVAERALAGLLGSLWAVLLLGVVLVLGLRPECPRLPAVPPEVLVPHAVRYGVAAGVALLLAGALGFRHGYWMALTVALVLRPGLAPTAERIAQRLAGTLLGGLAGVLIIELVPGDLAPALLAAVLLGLGASLMQSEYRLAATFITAGILAMLDIGHAATVELVDERLACTVIGVTIALVALILWPGPEEMAGPGPTPPAGAPRAAASSPSGHRPPSAPGPGRRRRSG
ncbi:MAG: FUSC family protein [Thermoleophilia bacterium]|nr:FUSC family protein [Thermoleophilia bacterium]